MLRHWLDLRRVKASDRMMMLAGRLEEGTKQLERQGGTYTAAPYLAPECIEKLNSTE